MNQPVAQYMRMSTDQQTLSIEMQGQAIAKYAALNDYQVVRTYVDEAKSGVMLEGREGMKQLLRDVTKFKCPFKAVLVLDVTRWGRFQDVDESAYYEYHCRKHGVEVKYVAEPFTDPNSPLSALLKQLKRTMAAEFSRELGIKSRAAQIEVVNHGFATGQLPCLGYRREAVSMDGTTRRLEHGERKPHKSDHVRWVLGPAEEVEAVKRVFSDYADGTIAVASILRRLEDLGIRSCYGRPITMMSMRLLLRNEIVIGNFVWGNRSRPCSVTDIARLPESVRNSTMVPPIIDQETWEKVQARNLASAAKSHPGPTRDVLVEMLKQVLRKNPALHRRSYSEHGIKSHGLRKHFGSLSNAYYAAERDSHIAEFANALSRPAAQWVGKRFLLDVASLLKSAGVVVEVNVHSNVLAFLGEAVKVRLAAQTVPEKCWRVHGIARGRMSDSWLLVLRLNQDRITGRDFLVIPPTDHATFGGRISAKRWGEMAEFQCADADELLERLLTLKGRGTVPSEDLRWSS